ncbi:MAG: hypothetical protein OSB68_02530 [Dehalococcoidia bacterium]|nr:hypothetical protein [Dehalococcoidia bacterium]
MKTTELRSDEITLPEMSLNPLIQPVVKISILTIILNETSDMYNAINQATWGG